MRITKKWLVVIIAILFSVLVAIAVSGCIPVTVRPQFDDKGVPIALPVTPTGTISPEGVLTPVYPISSDAPKPPAPIAWGDLLNIALGVLGVAGGGYGLVAGRILTKAKTALSLVASLADANASVASDAAKLPPEDADKVAERIENNKRLAAQMQEAAGVRTLIQKARKK